MVASHTLRKSAEHLHMQVVIDIKLPLNASMLEQENAIQAALNQAGLRCTGLLLESLDTDGQPLLVRDARGGQVRLSAKGRKVPRQIETPYGSLNVARHVYQSSAGGACLVPLDQAAALLGAATPKFAQMVASKVAELPARSVARDLSQNHQRAVSLAQLQDLSGRVGELARAQQEHLPMEQAELPAPWQVATITLGVDAASMLMNSAGTPAAASDRRKHRQLDWRMAMVGTISFHDAQGERLHTLYAAQSPPEDPGASFPSSHDPPRAEAESRHRFQRQKEGPECSREGEQRRRCKCGTSWRLKKSLDAAKRIVKDDGIIKGQPLPQMGAVESERLKAGAPEGPGAEVIRALQRREPSPHSSYPPKRDSPASPSARTPTPAPSPTNKSAN